MTTSAIKPLSPMSAGDYDNAGPDVFWPTNPTNTVDHRAKPHDPCPPQQAPPPLAIGPTPEPDGESHQAK